MNERKTIRLEDNEIVTKVEVTKISFENQKGETIITLKETRNNGTRIWDFPCLYRTTENLRELHAAIKMILKESSN